MIFSRPFGTRFQPELNPALKRRAIVGCPCRDRRQVEDRMRYEVVRIGYACRLPAGDTADYQTALLAMGVMAALPQA